MQISPAGSVGVQEIQRRIQADLQSHMTKYGYEVMDTPIIDSADLFLTKAGDQILTRLFTFERHGRQLALRPEFTAPAAYRYITQFPDESPIVRWQFSGPVFESDPYDLTRYYQRFSIGAELIGVAEIDAEAEVIHMAAQGLDLIGVPSWRLVMGHVRLMRHLLSTFGLDRRTERFLLNHRAELKDATQGKPYLSELLERHLPAQTESSQEVVIPRNGQTTMGGRSPQEIMRRLQEKRQRLDKQDQMLAAANFLYKWRMISGEPSVAFETLESLITDDVGQKMLNDWKTLVNQLHENGIPAQQIILQPDLARSWEYYTGLVFELRLGDNPVIVCGGGRYDELTRIIGGKRDVPAVGFAYYVDPLLQLLEKSQA
jgi:histidyl-tRNA synthetase